MSPKDKSKLSKEELLGRQSGSAAWRTARGEMGLGIETAAKVWRLTETERKSRAFHLEYDILADEYRRKSDGAAADSTSKGWASGASEVKAVMKKVEHDHQMVYLARTGN